MCVRVLRTVWRSPAPALFKHCVYIHTVVYQVAGGGDGKKGSHGCWRAIGISQSSVVEFEIRIYTPPAPVMQQQKVTMRCAGVEFQSKTAPPLIVSIFGKCVVSVCVWWGITTGFAFPLYIPFRSLYRTMLFLIVLMKRGVYVVYYRVMLCVCERN